MQENQRDGGEHVRAFTVANLELKPGSMQPQQRGGATLTQMDDGDVYLIGGANREATCFGDVHKFDLDTREWTLVKAEDSKFPARSGHSAVAIGQRIFVFGGLNSMACEVYNDVRVFDTQLRKWSKAKIADGEVPMPRNAHAAVLLPPSEANSSHHRMLIYGGSSPEDGTFDDAFALRIPVSTEECGDIKEHLKWEKVECCTREKPEARELHCATLLPGSASSSSPSLICFSGGRNVDGNICTDMVILDFTTWEWQLVPICEWNRCSHAAGLVDGALVSFGGFDGGAIRSDCWEYHEDAESWMRSNSGAENEDAHGDEKSGHENTDCPETSPAPTVLERFGHAGCTVTLNSPAASDKAEAAKQALLVFGGMNASSDLNDLVLIEQR